MVDSSRWTELLDVATCDIGSGSAGPGLDELRPHLVGVSRLPAAIVYEFLPGASIVLREFVDAERVCCSGLTWDVLTDGPLRLRIGATEPELDALVKMFAGA